ncbi:unnamed protein product [Aphanomyces euteiches]
MKYKKEVLTSLHEEFSADFHREFQAIDDYGRYNADETAWILEDKKTGPDHADAFIAGSERDPPHTNTTSESAIVTYTESPLTTLRKRDLEYRRLHHANSPEQRDPEKRSRQLPAEYSDEDMGSDTKSDLAPSPALDASEAKPSDHSGSELSLKPRSSLEELPCWESCDEASFPTQDLVHYDGDPVSTINVHFDDTFTPGDGSICNHQDRHYSCVSNDFRNNKRTDYSSFAPIT